MMKWDVRWKNKKWKSCEGHIIERFWDLIGVDRKSYFMCFINDKNYQLGRNFTTKDTIKEAKEACRLFKQEEIK